MAIEVVRMGQIPEEKQYRGSCSNCGTQIKCTKRDARYEPDGPCGQYGYWAVNCPLCNKSIAVREV